MQEGQKTNLLGPLLHFTCVPPSFYFVCLLLSLVLHARILELGNSSLVSNLDPGVKEKSFSRNSVIPYGGKIVIWKLWAPTQGCLITFRGICPINEQFGSDSSNMAFLKKYFLSSCCTMSEMRFTNTHIGIRLPLSKI